MIPPYGWNLFEGTLAHEAVLSGPGLHTGRMCRVRILPRSGIAEDRGLLLRRTDSPAGEKAEVRPDYRFWRNHPLCSTLQAKNGKLFRTVEHLLAALMFCEVDHAIVEMDSEEVPILDGSALGWVAVLQKSERVALPVPKAFIRIRRPFEYRFSSDCLYAAEPAETYAVNALIKERSFGIQTWEGDLTPPFFGQDIAPARSYGRIVEAIPALIAGYLTGRPILRGARFSSVAAIFNKQVIGGTRFPDEFIRHRVLDIAGDFAIAGAPLLGRFHVRQPSHRRNQKFMRTLLKKNPEAWEWVRFP